MSVELAIYKSGPLLLFNKVRKGLIVFITPVLYRTKIESYQNAAFTFGKIKVKHLEERGF